MARSHYVMDLFYPARPGAKPTRHDALRIDAEDDEAALAEARRIDAWRKTEFYQIRAIHNSVRTGDKLIFSSAVEAPAADTTTDATAGDSMPAEPPLAARAQQ